MSAAPVIEDEEFVPGLYVTNELRLYEVVEVNGTSALIRNVASEAAFWLPKKAIVKYRVVWPDPR